MSTSFPPSESSGFRPSLPPSLLLSLATYLLVPLRNGREELSFGVREGPSDRSEEQDHVCPGHDAVGELQGGKEGGGEGGKEGNELESKEGRAIEVRKRTTSARGTMRWVS